MLRNKFFSLQAVFNKCDCRLFNFCLISDIALLSGWAFVCWGHNLIGSEPITFLKDTSLHLAVINFSRILPKQDYLVCRQMLTARLVRTYELRIVCNMTNLL
jgi:hypothetical protein